MWCYLHHYCIVRHQVQAIVKEHRAHQVIDMVFSWTVESQRRVPVGLWDAGAYPPWRPLFWLLDYLQTKESLNTCERVHNRNLVPLKKSKLNHGEKTFSQHRVLPFWEPPAGLERWRPCSKSGKQHQHYELPLQRLPLLSAPTQIYWLLPVHAHAQTRTQSEFCSHLILWPLSDICSVVARRDNFDTILHFKKKIIREYIIIDAWIR